MQRAFFTRPPTSTELLLLRKFLACYRDGTGNHREVDGSSRADSRQIERCLAELLHGKTTENKSFYDFVLEFNESGGIAVRGASVKSKEISHLRKYPTNNIRAHLEISNSSAKDWQACFELGLTEADFRQHQHPDKFGSVILERQRTERILSQASYLSKLQKDTEKWFEEKECIFISVLYSPLEKGERVYLVSAFPVLLPKPFLWEFNKLRLVGRDEDESVLYEWYALSGSQFKYYPKINSRLNGTELFGLPRPALEDLRAKASRLFGV
jgi:hypothetical protein